MALKDTLDQMDLIDIIRAFQPKETEYAYFSSAHGMFLMVDQMLGHRKTLIKFKETEIISSIFSDYQAMKFKINHKNTEKHTETWKLNNMLLNNEWVNNKVKEEIKRYLETNENEKQKSKTCGTQEKQS